jgi:excisionase family DNA binding protein
MPFMDIRVGRMIEKIKIPRPAVELLNEILENMSNGIPVTLTPMVKVLTTREAAELLGCSRPHLVKLLETGQIEFVKIGKHRRIKYADLLKYLEKRKADQKKHLISLMAADEEAGLYDV